MWIHTTKGFLSAVLDLNDPTKRTLLVRGRFPGDLEAVLGPHVPDLVVEETPSYDYRYRARVLKSELALVLLGAIEAVRYPNFKDAIDPAAKKRAPGRDGVLLSFWAASKRVQDQDQLEGFEAGPGFRWDLREDLDDDPDEPIKRFPEWPFLYETALEKPRAMLRDDLDDDPEDGDRPCLHCGLGEGVHGHGETGLFDSLSYEAC